MHVDDRLLAAREVEAAAQRGQRAVAVDPRHRIGSHVRGCMLERDPRLGCALDVELQHVAVMLVVHGGLLSWAMVVERADGASGWTRTTGLGLRRVALLPLS